MRVYTDAARDDNIAGFGWEIVISNETIEGSRYINDNCTSMEAEFYALLDGLRHARRHGTNKIEIFCDCKPLIKKMRPSAETGVWQKRRKGFERLVEKFDEWELEWTPRTANSNADRLAYEALEEGRQS